MDELITTRLAAAIQTAAPAEALVLEKQEPKFAHRIDDEEPATGPHIVYPSYSHNGHFWHTPPSFALPPRMKLDTGWKIWPTGIT
jgi:hypothetical protein